VDNGGGVQWTTVVVWSGAAVTGMRTQREEKKREDKKEKQRGNPCWEKKNVRHRLYGEPM